MGYRGLSHECLQRNTTDRQGVPRKGTLLAAAQQHLKTHCPLREMSSLTSQITAQGQGERGERFHRGGVPPPGCLQDSSFGRGGSVRPWPASTMEAPGQALSQHVGARKQDDVN